MPFARFLSRIAGHPGDSQQHGDALQEQHFELHEALKHESNSCDAQAETRIALDAWLRRSPGPEVPVTSQSVAYRAAFPLRRDMALQRFGRE